MTKILMKLKEGALRTFLTTASGYTIVKEKYEEVEDSDREIQGFILNRNDILIKEIPKKIVDTPVSDKKETFKEDIPKNIIKDEKKKGKNDDTQSKD